MELGLFFLPTDETIDIVELGSAAEFHGLDALFVPEHTHIPASRETPYPGGGDLPREYQRTLDPFVVLSAVAAVTERLRLGTAICLVTERDPITTAKAVASLDRLSGGRFAFGVGAGWNAEEMRNHGTDPDRRMALMRERVLAIQRIWTEDKVEFHGEFVDFEPLWSWPKPLQNPHPPILVSGSGKTVLDRVLEYGQGWMVLLGRVSFDVLAGRIAELKQRAEARDLPAPEVVLVRARPEAEAVRRYEEAGVTTCLFQPPSARANVVLPLVEQYAGLRRALADRS